MSIAVHRAIFFLIGIGLTVGSVGCNVELSSGKALPAPLSEVLPYEFNGSVNRQWGADHFEVNDHGTMHFVILENVIAPKRGQGFFKESRQASLKLLRSSTLRVVITGRDDFQREIGNVFVDDKDLSLELLRMGFVWVNFPANETNSNLQKQYLKAQAMARREKTGLWSEPNPVHPAEFDSSK